MSSNATPKSKVGKEQEIWMDVSGYEGLYKVSNKGRVKVLRHMTVTINGKKYHWPEKIISSKPGPYGHMFVGLRKNGVTKNKPVHRLVLESFVSSCPKGMECRHMNGESSDNRVENLTWGTHAENMRDKIKHGTNNSGSKSHLAQVKLNDEVVTRMIRMWETGDYDTYQLAEIFQVGYGTVWTITRGCTWKHIKRLKFPSTKKRSKKNRKGKELTPTPTW